MKQDIDLSGAERDGYYVVDVKFRPNNPMHRAIMRIAARGNLKHIMTDSVEDPPTRVGSLNYLRVISRIEGIG